MSTMSRSLLCPFSRREWLRRAAASTAALQLGGLAIADEPKTSPKVERDPALAERARKLMRDAIVIDAYNCGAYSKHRHEPTGWFNQRGPTQVDLIKAIDGCVTAAG